MRNLFVLALTCLFLGGCFSTEEELFSFEGGEKSPLEPGVYDCEFFEKPAEPGFMEGAMVATEVYNGKNQYVFFSPGEPWAPIFSLHRVSGDLFLAVGSSEDPGQTIRIVTITADSLILHDSWQDPVVDQIREMAAKHKVDVNLKYATWNMSGSVENQKALVFDVAMNLNLPASMVCKPQPEPEEPEEDTDPLE